MSFSKRFAADMTLTLAGLVAAVMAFAFSFHLSSQVRGELGRIQEEASVARARAALQAIDQDLQNLADYTLGYAMWDDTYAFVQYPTTGYLETNYAESVVAASPVELVGIYDAEGKILFATALDEQEKTIAVPPEISTPEFRARVTASKRLDEAACFARVEWLGGRPYLLTAWPVTNSNRTAPARGTILFGALLGPKMLDRITTLTTVSVKPVHSPSDAPASGLEVRTPLLGTAHISLTHSKDDRSFTARASLDDREPQAPAVDFELEVPSRLSQAAQRLEKIVHTDFLCVAAAFAAFAAFAGWEISRRRRESERLTIERRNAEILADKAASADRAKSAFLAVMSHEIRTPLNAIIGYADILRAAPLDPESAEGVRTIQESSTVLLRVLNDILDFSKIEAGALGLHPEPVSPRQLVEGVRLLFDLQAKRQETRLVFVVDSVVPDQVVVDGTRLRQILGNLVSNAVKFTPRGEVQITVTADSATRRLAIDVADDGIGIAPGQEQNLFLAFSQMDTTASRRHNGTGLGLAITRRLCDLMGGRVNFQRREPRGSIFSVEIPYEPFEGAPPSPTPAASPPPSAAEPASAADILIVDDNPTNARLLTAILKRFGYSSRVAPGGADALSSYEAHPARLIFMDLQMPDMDGFETTRRIRAMEADRNLPPCRIIAVTADILEASHREAHKAGMDGFLCKPVDAEQIRIAVESLEHAS